MTVCEVWPKKAFPLVKQLVHCSVWLEGKNIPIFWECDVLNAAYEKCKSNYSAEHEGSRLSPSCRLFLQHKS